MKKSPEAAVEMVSTSLGSMHSSDHDEKPLNWWSDQQHKVLRMALDHCSLFGLTTGLRVLEVGHGEQGLEERFRHSLPDVDYRATDISDRQPAELSVAETGRDAGEFDVVIINHIYQALDMHDFQSVLVRAWASTRKNGILIFVDFIDFYAPITTDLVTVSPRLQEWFESLFGDAQCLAIACDILPPCILNKEGKTGTPHLRAVLRRNLAGVPALFSQDDYTFEMARSFGRSLSTGFKFGVVREKWNLIIGRSGSGKTSFLRALQGDLKPYTPGCEWFPDDNYFYMSQNVDVFENLSPIQNVRAYGGTRTDALSYFEELGMTKLFQKRKHTALISGGERQRLLVAQIMAANPRLVILDEPSKGLDRAGRLVVFDALAERFSVRPEGEAATVICADHDFAGIYTLFDYVFEIRDGLQTLVWEKGQEAD